MGARRKLNVAYVNGSLFLAAVVGLLAQSWVVFFLVLVVALIGNFVTGEIRPRGRSR